MQGAKAASQPVTASAAKPQRATGSNDVAGTRSLKLTERFYARRRDLWECFTDVRRVQGFTQSAAKVVLC